MLGKAFKNIYFVFAAVLAVFVAGGTAVVAVFYKINALHILISVILWAGVFLLMHRYADRKAVVVCAAAAGVIFRILYAVFCTQAPESDFKLYYDMASAFSMGNYNISDYARSFPHIIGFSSVLGVWFKLFGVSVAAARIMGVVFDIFTGFFLFASSYRMLGRKAAGISVLLFSLSPSVILYSGLVCTEKCSVMLVLLFLTLITFINKKAYFAVCACAFTAVLANAVRPNGVILFITLILSSLVLIKGIKKRLICIILCTAVYIISSALYGAVIAHTFGSVASNPTGWNLYVGFNTQSYGQWNEEDADVFGKITAEKAPDDVHKALRDMSAERLKNNTVWENIKLLPSKFAVMWSNDIAVCSYLKNDIIYKTLYRIFSLEAIITGFYIMLCICTLYSSILFAGKRREECVPVMLVVLGTAALHLLSEVMGRYAYPAIICMFLLCGVTANEKKTKPLLR